MASLNCWEYMKCSRENGGEKAEEFGVCPAVTETRVDGVHGGKNGGRSCWAITDTLCDDKVQGTWVSKFQNCLFCGFYNKVKEEAGANFINGFKLLWMLRS